MNQRSGDDQQITFLPIIVKIVAAAFREHPMMNSSLEGDEIVLHRCVNIGIATSTPDGLMVPVVKDVEGRTIRDIANEITRLVSAARVRTISRDDLSGGTYTVNNIGALGGSFATPLIRYPEAGILAFGRIVEKPVVEAGQVVVRPMLPLSIVADHRVLDGDGLGAFASTVQDAIMVPAILMTLLGLA